MQDPPGHVLAVVEPTNANWLQTSARGMSGLNPDRSCGRF